MGIDCCGRHAFSAPHRWDEETLQLVLFFTLDDFTSYFYRDTVKAIFKSFI
jgi:hypothetical protein